jgi:nanoRNase/pAp phosphatase (c-di-AMP/oligoRNAs hydrolase)
MTSPIETETFRRAFDFALDNMIVMLKEAQDYLGGGKDMAAIGTLTDIEDRFADLTAAMRLFVRSKRKP